MCDNLGGDFGLAGNLGSTLLRGVLWTASLSSDESMVTEGETLPEAKVVAAELEIVVRRGDRRMAVFRLVAPR